MLSFDRMTTSAANLLQRDQQSTPLTTGAPSWFMSATVIDGSKPVRITLVWTDRFSSSVGGTGGQTPAVVNNLNVYACYIGGFACWYGNDLAQEPAGNLLR